MEDYEKEEQLREKYEKEWKKDLMHKWQKSQQEKEEIEQFWEAEWNESDSHRNKRKAEQLTDLNNQVDKWLKIVLVTSLLLLGFLCCVCRGVVRKMDENQVKLELLVFGNQNAPAQAVYQVQALDNESVAVGTAIN